MPKLSIIVLNIFLTWVLTKFMINPFKRLIPDIPNHRSAHKLSIPRGGGLAIIISNLLTCSLFNQNSFFFLVPLSVISLVDDIKNLSKWIRLFTQISTTFFIFYSSNYFAYIKGHHDSLFIIVESLFIVIFCTGIINFCNFMDGIDGILAGLILVFLISAAIIFNLPVVGIVGAVIGFLIWNWNPAKIFLGDIGSNFLGGVVVWILLNTNNFSHTISLSIILFPLIFDPITCLVRRVKHKHNIFEAHSLHLFQRLVKGGFSQRKVALIYIGSSLILSLSLVIGGIQLQIINLFLILFFGIWINHKYAKNFRTS